MKCLRDRSVYALVAMYSLLTITVQLLSLVFVSEGFAKNPIRKYEVPKLWKKTGLA